MSIKHILMDKERPFIVIDGYCGLMMGFKESEFMWLEQSSMLHDSLGINADLSGAPIKYLNRNSERTKKTDRIPYGIEDSSQLAARFFKTG